MNGSDRAPRWELAEALAAVCDTPAAAATASRALGLGAVSGEGHTQAFVLDCPPYASIHLGPDGQLGGEAAERVADFCRTVGIGPAPEADHLSALLCVYAWLGRRADDAGDRTRRASLERARRVLVWEHLRPWVPGYTAALEQVASPPLAAWARLVRRLVATEPLPERTAAGQGLPAVLRQAPPPLDASGSRPELLAGLLSPARSGIVLTRRQLSAACDQLHLGRRVGERRFTLGAMLDQDAAATLDWLAGQTLRWRGFHEGAGDAVGAWWAARAAHTAGQLATLAGRPSRPRPAGPPPAPAAPGLHAPTRL